MHDRKLSDRPNSLYHPRHRRGALAVSSPPPIGFRLPCHLASTTTSRDSAIDRWVAPGPSHRKHPPPPIRESAGRRNCTNKSRYRPKRSNGSWCATHTKRRPLHRDPKRAGCDSPKDAISDPAATARCAPIHRQSDATLRPSMNPFPTPTSVYSNQPTEIFHSFVLFVQNVRYRTARRQHPLIYDQSNR